MKTITRKVVTKKVRGFHGETFWFHVNHAERTVEFSEHNCPGPAVYAETLASVLFEDKDIRRLHEVEGGNPHAFRYTERIGYSGCVDVTFYERTYGNAPAWQVAADPRANWQRSFEIHISMADKFNYGLPKKLSAGQLSALAWYLVGYMPKRRGFKYLPCGRAFEGALPLCELREHHAGELFTTRIVDALVEHTEDFSQIILEGPKMKSGLQVTARIAAVNDSDFRVRFDIHVPEGMDPECRLAHKRGINLEELSYYETASLPIEQFLFNPTLELLTFFKGMSKGHSWKGWEL